MIANSQDTILIVDDSPTHLELLTLPLRHAGYRVFTVESGAKALEQALVLKPDLILLDVMMPHMDGFETCRRLKIEPETRDIPIIFMTALADTPNKIAGFEAGGVDYITKPAQMAEVMARLKTHLTLRRLQKNLHCQTTKLAALNEQLRQDIIRRERAEKALQQAHHEERRQRHLAEERNKELDAFAHTVAHDLKGPLALIIGFADILLNHFIDTEPEQFLQTLKRIRQAGHKGVNIIEELLLLASTRKQNVSLEALNMMTIIESAAQRVGFLKEGGEGEIILPESWPTVTGYGPWVEAVWVNYLSNGLKYGGRPPRLEVGATPQGEGMVRFWVRDNGPGLTPAAQAQLFTEFTRLEELRAEGHGLGLSIVRHIVEKLGGEVGVESQQGQGSTFYFTLLRADQQDHLNFSSNNHKRYSENVKPLAAQS